MKKILILGASGMVGSAITRALRPRGYELGLPHFDLCNLDGVYECMHDLEPDAVIMAAGKVGGIIDNSRHQEMFLFENAIMGLNVIHACGELEVPRLIYLGSSCIYPRDCPQPMRPDDLMTGRLEPTNLGYAMAKLTCLELCKAYSEKKGLDYITAIPSNLYGPGDNYGPGGHVVAALVRKFCDAVALGNPEVVVGGDGTPLREITHVDDCARAIVGLLEHTPRVMIPSVVNVGSGEEYSIRELAYKVAEMVRYDEGKVLWDSSIPNGMPRKVMESSFIRRHLGWTPNVSLHNGLKQSINEYLCNHYPSAT